MRDEAGALGAQRIKTPMRSESTLCMHGPITMTLPPNDKTTNQPVESKALAIEQNKMGAPAINGKLHI